MLYSYIGGTSPVLVLQLFFSQEEEISSIMFHPLVTLTINPGHSSCKKQLNDLAPWDTSLQNGGAVFLRCFHHLSGQPYPKVIGNSTLLWSESRNHFLHG